MAGFENLAAIYPTMPTTRDVIARIRREDRCEGNPLSRYCTRDRSTVIRLLAEEITDLEVCSHCPHFGQKLQQMLAEWEEWHLLRQDTFT